MNQKSQSTTLGQKVLATVLGAIMVGALVGHHFWYLLAPLPRAFDCTGRTGEQITVTITDSVFVPASVSAHLCDTLLITNTASYPAWPAAGPHPDHHTFPEFDSGRAILPGETYSVLLNRTGVFSFHDHLHDKIVGTLEVR